MFDFRKLQSMRCPFVLAAIAAVTIVASTGIGEDSPLPQDSPNPVVAPTLLEPTDKEAPRFSAEIEADLKELSAPEFLARESAGRRMLARKLDAVEPLLFQAQSGPAEASVRAFDLLRQLYREGDDETNERVELAFETLTRSENPTVATRAEAAIDAGTPIRHSKAIARFRKFGGTIRFRTIEGEPAEDESLLPIDYALVDKSWTGGDAGLTQLRRIEDFRIQSEVRGAALFVIKGSSVTDDALAELQGALPALNIQRRGPACFGITPYSQFGGPMGLQIYMVKPGSAADRAGLRQDDMLLKFNEHPIIDFKSLVDKISEKQPGDKVPVVYERDGVQNTVTIELRGWE